MKIWKVYVEYIDIKNNKVTKKDYFYSDKNLAQACYNFYKHSMWVWASKPEEIELDKNWED
jgi:hypothetical protein